MLQELFMGMHGALPSFVEVAEEGKNIRIVRLKGPIDMLTIPGIEKFVRVARRKKRISKKNILIDFKNVTHVDSSTIAMLLEAISELKHEKYRLILINLTKQLKSLLEILKIERQFYICDSEEKAIQELTI